MDQAGYVGWLTALAPVIVAMFSGLAIVVNGWRERRSKQKSIKAALLAEVTALAEIIRGRGYVDDLDKAVTHLQQGGDLYGIVVRVPDHYCRIYTAHLESVGTLSPEQASKVVTFYQLIDSVVQDVTPGGHLAEGTDDPSAFRQAKLFLEQALQLADELGSS